MLPVSLPNPTGNEGNAPRPGPSDQAPGEIPTAPPPTPSVSPVQASVENGTAPRPRATSAERLQSLFASGLTLGDRAFTFGETVNEVNSKLTTPFDITSLPRAGEYTNEDVRYFWVRLSQEPQIQAALAPSDVLGAHCIDPQSYIAFFFKGQKFFRISIRLTTASACAPYDWLLDTLLDPPERSARMVTGSTSTYVLTHVDPDWTYIDVMREGIANDIPAIRGLSESVTRERTPQRSVPAAPGSVSVQ